MRSCRRGRSTDCLLFIVDLLFYERKWFYDKVLCMVLYIVLHEKPQSGVFTSRSRLLPSPFLREALKFRKLIRRTNKLIK
mgnify:CR=1 FL=1